VILNHRQTCSRITGGIDWIKPMEDLMKMQKSEQNKYVLGTVLTAQKIAFEALISKKEIVVAFGVSSSFVNKLMAEEGLPHFKIGRAVRFRISDVSAWLEKRRMS
jgi:excisionase family DNA binding protein